MQNRTTLNFYNEEGRPILWLPVYEDGNPKYLGKELYNVLKNTDCKIFSNNAQFLRYVSSFIYGDTLGMDYKYRILIKNEQFHVEVHTKEELDPIFDGNLEEFYIWVKERSRS